jgi:protein FRA10AC1
VSFPILTFFIIVRLCPECSKKLNYKKNKEGKRKREEADDVIEDSRQMKQLTDPVSEAACSSIPRNDDDGEGERSSKAWTQRIEVETTESKEEEDIDKFLAEMGLLI